jgi:antitoxin MazE
MTKLTVRKIGNSYGVILPQEALAALNVGEGDSLALVRNGADFSLMKRDADFDRIMNLLPDFFKRYHNTLTELAK